MAQWKLFLGDSELSSVTTTNFECVFPENTETTDKVYTVKCTGDSGCEAQTNYTVPGKTVDCSSYGWTAQSPTLAYDYTGTSIGAYTDGFSSLPTWDGNPSWAHHPFMVPSHPGKPLIFNAFDANPGPGSRTETAKFTTAEGCEFTTTITQSAPPCGHFTYEFIGDKQSADTLDLTWDDDQTGTYRTSGHTTDHYIITGTSSDCEGNYLEPSVLNSKSGYPYWRKTVTNTGGINYRIEIWFNGVYNRDSVNNQFTIKNPNTTENMLIFTPTVTKPTLNVTWYLDWRGQTSEYTKTLFYLIVNVERDVTPEVASGCNIKLHVTVNSDSSIKCPDCATYIGWDYDYFSSYISVTQATNEFACPVNAVPYKCYTQQGYVTACYPATSYASVDCDGWAETKVVEGLAFKYLYTEG